MMMVMMMVAMMVAMMVVICKVVQKKETKKVDLNQLIIKNHPKKILKNLLKRIHPKKKFKEGVQKKETDHPRKTQIKVLKNHQKTKLEVPEKVVNVPQNKIKIENVI